MHIPEEKVLFVGDVVTPNQPPFFAQADLEVWHQTLNELASRKYYEYTIISGRGGPISVEIIRGQRKFNKSVRGRLQTLAKHDSEPEETQNMIPALLDKLSYPPEKQELFEERLKHGLAAYYARHHQKKEPDEEE